MVILATSSVQSIIQIINNCEKTCFCLSVDEKDRQNGYDPERELADSGLKDFQRAWVFYYYLWYVYIDFLRPG